MGTYHQLTEYQRYLHRSGRGAGVAHGKGNLARVEKAGQRTIFGTPRSEEGNAPLVQILGRA